MLRRTKRSFIRAKNWYFAHERRFMALALFIGFAVDSVTLQRIDLLFENLILLSHLTFVASGIAFINLYDAGKLNWLPLLYIRPWVPLVMQFSFGALFSGFFIFYFRSASIASSWLFLLFLLALLVGNEMFRKRYEQLVFQTSIFYIALSSYLIFSVPVVVNEIGPFVFVLSMCVSGAVMFALLLALGRYIPAQMEYSRKYLVRSIGGISLALVVLYFTNIIPPIPLSLKDADVYHFVNRVGATYEIRTEAEPWYEKLLPYERVHITPGAPLYVYSSVFAPTDINVDIVHNWQRKADDVNRWVSVSQIPFAIYGGTDGGYRGYTLKRTITPGWWRVDIETERGQQLGRLLFRVEEVARQPEYITEIRL